MHRILSLIAAIICCAFNSYAQDNKALESARIDMIRQAVIFYSHDKKLAEKPLAGCEATEISGLKDCAKDLANVGSKIDKWAAAALPDVAHLKGLGEAIKEEVAGGGKDYRKKMEEYPGFIAGIDKVVAGIPEAQPAQEPAPVATAMTDTLKPPATKPAEATFTPVPESKAGFISAPNIWTVLALLLSIAALAKTFLTPKRKESSQRTTGINYGNTEQKTNSDEVARNLQKTELELVSINSMFKEMDERLSGKIRKLEQMEDAAPVQQWSSAINTAMDNNTSQPRIKYAKTADGNGFDASSLSDEPDSKKIFEITPDAGGQGATYRVAGNREAQQFALANVNVYLRDACEYNSTPDGSNSTITTTRPGRLELQGGKWKIVSKAQISFS